MDFSKESGLIQIFLIVLVLTQCIGEDVDTPFKSINDDDKDYQNDYGYGGGSYSSSSSFSKSGIVPQEIQDKFIKSSAYKTGSSYGIKSLPVGSSYGTAKSYSSSYGAHELSSNKLSGSLYGIKSATSKPELFFHSNELGKGNSSYEFKLIKTEKHYSSKTGKTSAESGKKFLEMQSGSNSVEVSRKTCTQKPKSIINASVKCTIITNTCKAKCIEGYQFPNGETYMKVICDAGEWTLENLEWSDTLACEPICMPPCKNNGMCIQPGMCSCPENFVGPYCEHEKKLCLTPPPLPKNSKLSCSSTTCTITCASGHRFPDGSSITNMICKEGDWAPSRSELATIPDCLPVCTPSCQNGGQCLSYNVCQCPQDFRGKQCQFSVDVCSPKKMNFNGAFNCSGDNEVFRCTLSCPIGIQFTSEVASVYTCTYEKGYYSPAVIPQCNYSASMEIISGGGMSQSRYRSQNLTTVLSGSAKNKIKIISKKKNHKFSMDYDDEDEDGSYEKIITKTKILIKKGRKNKKTGSGHYGSGEEDYDELYDEENNESSQGIRLAGAYSLYMSGNITVKHRIPKPATCVTWNGNKVKTFDGVVYKRNLYCSHTLVQDNIDGTFGIVLRSCPYGSKAQCPHAIDIRLMNAKYTIENLNGTVKLFNEKKDITIPTQLMGMRVTKTGFNYKIHMELVGITMIWDTERMLSVEATAGLFNRTAGLCGTLDQHIRNDFMSKDGTIHKLASTFVDAWQVQSSNDVTDNCADDRQNDEGLELVCSDEIKSKAEKVCQKLLNSGKFVDCLKTMHEATMLETCISDYCYCSHENREQCACQGITVFAKDCQFQGIQINSNWRDMEICPLQCNNGRIYKACGPSFEQSCGSASEDIIGTNCIEGCFCPDGTIQHDGECIRLDECPCNLRGKTFKPNSQILKDCNTCKCDKGIWKCSKETCGARCGAIGDPHYLTFDGKHFDFMGKCSYYLLKRDNFSIEAENVACPGSISESMNFSPAGVDMPSCTKSVTINVLHDNKTKSIKLKQGGQVLIDGYEITKLPLKIFDGLMRIRHASSIMMLVAFKDGLKVWWDGMTRVYIDAPASYHGKTQGLCGTFTDNLQDDFLTPEGDIESSVTSFANKWRTKETCEYVDDNVNVPHPCQLNMEKKEKAVKACAKLKGKIFEECHWSVDPEPYYEDCLYDMCACKGDTAACMCPIFAAYSNECGRHGSVVGWRHTVTECAIKCPAGQIYEECADKCFRSCADIESTQPCKTKCVEGCRCPNGEALDENNECIPIGLCPCLYKGITFNSGYKEVRPGTKHLDLCTCTGAVWKCEEAKDIDKDKYPPAFDIRSRCLVDNHEEFTTCEPVEQKTCKNMLDYQPITKVDCRPGCVCKNGYVFDLSLKKCVLPAACSCHHGSKSYADGDKIKSDCNTCSCKAGSWNCTNRPCPATCTAWGDSHFETYDGKYFDFQGACNYVLSKGAFETGEGFTVTIQNVLCGSMGVTCSKSVTMALLGKEAESVTLNSDSAAQGTLLSKKDTREIVTSDSLRKMSIHRAGIFVVIEVPGMGVQLKWDRGTRIYVQLSSRWKGRVQGLCGNYDGDALNDLNSPSSGLETNAMIFGNSWKLEEFCPLPTDQIDACKQHPERKIWAEKKCGILKSSTFAACHSEVEVDKYIKRCVFDTCACDQGGDCECLCTALAAYAHACTMKGVPLKWRTPDLCPMQCDPHCSEYKPCISACPLETCDNTLDQAKDQRLCGEDSCVEGCQLKPCPDGELYRNSSYTECVPKSICRPICIEIDGKAFYEGDVTKSDNCQTCHCTKGKETCMGMPCTPTSILPGHGPPTKQSDADESCKSGWSEWINQDQLSDQAKTEKKNMKISDIEPLPSAFSLKNFKNSAFCTTELMKQIECRTVDTHMEPKRLGEDVECSLEKGLICAGPCHDYEIRIMCDCDDNIEIFTLPTLDHHLPTKAPLIQSTTEALIDKACDSAIPHIEKAGDCHKFLHCAPTLSGTWAYVEKTCGSSMMFNPNTMICDHIYNVIKLKPLCEETSTLKPPTTEAVVKKIDKCQPGKVWSECAVPCGRACHFYSKFLKTSGLCTGTHNSCDNGCVPETAAVDCPNGHFWRDDKVCVKVADCTCMSDDGNIVKPGAVYQESDCKICQCIDNVYVCDSESCEIKSKNESIKMNAQKPKLETDFVGEPRKSEKRKKPPNAVVISTVTPPMKCEAAKLVPLIDGSNPIPDSAFNASSYLASSFMPRFARLNAKSTVDSSGSWSPEINDQMQYLQIGFEKPVPIFGVIIRGSPIFDQYVTSFKILHSIEGIAFHYLIDETTHPQIFSGAIDSRTAIKSMFKIPIEAKVVRIYPLTWHGSIAIRVELLGCSNEIANITTPHHEENEEEPMCDDPLGVANGKLHPEQIELSSFKPNIQKAEAREMLKLTSLKGWRPNIDSPNEFVVFDFYQPRNITGVKSKGGEYGWVKAYTIQYTQNFKIWNVLQNPDGSPKLFLGNFDSTTPKVNNFKYPIQARALKIIPIKWHDCIELKIEPLGCFIPYEVPVLSPLIILSNATEAPPTETVCGICPGVLYAPFPIEGTCRCYPPLYWDGDQCVQRSTCPCTVGHLSYGVGAQFEKEDCSKCVCVLGGVAQCKPQECAPCGVGLRRAHDASCLCLCEPCPDDQIICPSSGACILESSWCDGVQDCPDDEVNCAYKVRLKPKTIKTVKEKLIITQTCPDPSCPPGFTIKLGTVKESKKSAMLQMNKKSAGIKGMYKNNAYANDIEKFESTLPLPNEFEEKNFDDCVEFNCVPEKPKKISKTQTEKLSCPAPSCPTGYEVVLDVSQQLKQCAKYKCEPNQQKDVVCNITGRTINTFDGIEYKYDICDHVLARDLVSNKWTISILKNCSAGNFVCKKEIIINDKECDIVIVLYTDLTLQLDGYLFTVEQLQKSTYSKMKTFVVSKVGNSIVFVSHLQGFWVRLDDTGDVKIGVSAKYSTAVDGLCGYYNDDRTDDKRLPNGTTVLSSVDFGDGWYTNQKTTKSCQPHACSEGIQEIAWNLCNNVKDEVFAPCAKTINIDHFISRCLETACECLTNSVSSNSTIETNLKERLSCKCSILQSFITECMASDENIHLDTWRFKNDCVITCPPQLVHRDCYRRRCETSCETLHQEDCPYLPGTCFSGCYCPEGTVRKGDTCIAVNECKDCICDGFGRSQYITYDRKNFTFDGNCTYLLTRDLLVPNLHTFQIYVTLGPCDDQSAMAPLKIIENLQSNKFGTKLTCTKSLHILYGEHIIHLQRNSTSDNSRVTTLIDGIKAITLPYKSKWISISEDRAKGININLEDSQVEIDAMFADLSFSIRVPSIKYGSKLEGICGDCNGNPHDDLKINPKYSKKIQNDSLNGIIQTWLSDEPALKLEEKCISHENSLTDCIPLPAESDPCLGILDQNIFGKCHLLVDPAMYVALCQSDMCKTGPVKEGVCSHLAAYARECSRNGICIDWKKEACDDKLKCAHDMEYKACSCQQTCEIITDKTHNVCAEQKEGCFCRDGKVLNNGKCIPLKECTPCDDLGHFAGEIWYPDKCNTCECGITGVINCTKKQCSSTGMVCELGFKQILVDTNDACCPSYKCIPEKALEKCPDAPLPNCASDQFNKIVTDKNNCSKFVCECKPIDQCKQIELRPLRIGEKIINETTGCCPTSTIVCDKFQCPAKPNKCNQEFYEVVQKDNLPVDVCCDEFECVPPKKNCIADINGVKKLKNIGEIWSTSDPCMHKKCTYGAGGILIEINEKQACPVFTCSVGYKLEIPKDRCCGECIQNKCVVNGTVYEPGTEWHSKDNCTTFKCLLHGNQLVVSTSQSTCPDITGCSDELKYFENCCQRCKLKTEDQKTCLPISLGDTETVGLVEQVHKEHGKCVNTQAIRGFTECHGTCNSGTKYNRNTFNQDRKCQCCSIGSYEEIKVPVKCFDGTKLVIPISVPKSCTCQSCENEEQLKQPNAYEFLKSTLSY